MDLSKTLEQLETDYWEEPSFDSHLVKACHELRKKALKDFSIEDLRILIGQQFSLKYLIPLAINELEKNILAEGDLYAGDLLFAVLRVDHNYWNDHEIEWTKVYQLVNSKNELINTSINCESITKDFIKAIEKLKKR